MGYILDSLRAEFNNEAETNIFGRKKVKVPKDGATLYLSARMHDAEDHAKDMEALAVATERAAIDILRRYDGDGSLVNEFKQQIDIRKLHQ